MKTEMMKIKNAVKILRLTPPMSFSALKPGPVVPPGIEKVPNQAARISQSVSFTHLSDILGFLRGGRFFTIFCHFLWFSFYHFFAFSIFWFCHFSHFLDFVDFDHFLSFVIFCHFSCFFTICNYFWVLKRVS